MSPSAMRRAAKQKLASLEMPACRDIFEFADALSAQRAIPLHLLPVAIRPSDPCGLWLSTPDADFIAYEAAASQPHQHHIIAHELGHIIYGHKGSPATSSESSKLLFPDLDPGLVLDMLGRTGYSERQEQEAETIASTIHDTFRRRHSTRIDEAPIADQIQLRIRRSLG
ncbi:hypothetical protein ACQPW1_30245 [Nocardia sp. CA-128927]|uniref:hypothetical protein n=1 Tax=Nocardia sp. CA-128927 TaxID=3239975 RepID=UPI003D97C4FB